MTTMQPDQAAAAVQPLEAAPPSLIAPLTARAVTYSRATARATVQAAPSLLAAVRFRPFTDLIDIACGPGHLAGAATALGARAVGLDISAEMIAVARSRHVAAEFRVGDATAIPESDERFDLAVCNFGAAHVPDRGRLFDEAHRVLRPGGRFGFTEWRGPEASPFFAAVAQAIAAAGAGAGVAPLDPTAFALGSSKAADAALEASGFVDRFVTDLPIVYSAPEGDFLALFDDLALPFAHPRTPGPGLDAFRAALNDRMARFRRDGRFEIPMPAVLAAGSRAVA